MTTKRPFGMAAIATFALLVLGAGPAAQAGPVVGTTAASSVSPTNATMNGTVNPNGLATTAWFEWGPGTAYTQQTAPVDAGSDTNDVPLSVAVTSLTPGLVYHYRTVATNSTGLSRGPEARFWGPVVLTLGANPLTNECHSPYIDPGTKAVGFPAMLSAGAHHTTALKADGTLTAWGDNSRSQTNLSPSATNVAAISAGGNFTLALRQDHTLLAMGDTAPNVLTVPPSATNIMAFSAGVSHAVVLRTDGTVVVWGDGTNNDTNAPASMTNLIAIAAGQFFTVAVRSNGTVTGWGDVTSGGLTIPSSASNVVAVSAGFYHAVALRADGTVVAWGQNSSGQTSVPASATNVIAISAGGSHSLALKADGTVVAWGYNFYGQTNVPAIATNVVAIAAGGYHNVALRGDGTVIGWGAGTFVASDGVDYGQAITPAAVTNLNLAVTPSGAVQANVPGAYQLTYTTTNAPGVMGATVRNVTVVDTTPPQLSLQGANPFSLPFGSPFSDPGATATDVCAGDLTGNIQITGSVNPNQLGTNVLTYTVSDPGGNTTTSNRTVLVTGLASITGVGASITGTNAGLGSPNALLSGTVNPDGMPAAAWFQYGLSAAYGAASPPVSLPLSFSASNLVFALNGLLPGVVYHYRVVATNSLGTAASPDQTLSAPAVGAPGDLNGDGIVDQHELNTVLSNYWPNSPWLYMTNVMKLDSGLFQFSLTNQSAWDFSVQVSTNLADWSPLGPAYPVYQFVDPVTNGPLRYYRLRWP